MTRKVCRTTRRTFIHELLIFRPAKLSKIPERKKLKTKQNVPKSSEHLPLLWQSLAHNVQNMWMENSFNWKFMWVLQQEEEGGGRRSDMVSGCRTERNAPLKYFAFSGFRRRRRRRPKEALIVRVMQRPEKEVNMLLFLTPYSPFIPRLFRAKNICSRRQARPGQDRAGQGRREGRQCVCLPAASSRPKWA